MPYINPKYRPELDRHIDALAREISGICQTQFTQNDAAFSGLLNYCCTRLALRVIQLQFGKIRYWIVATTTGVFHNVADEFYRRLGVPYENRQIEVSGDVDLYREMLAEMEATPMPPKADPTTGTGQ